MICKPCGEQNHNNCKNQSTETNTGCDCQHREKSVLGSSKTQVTLNGIFTHEMFKVDPLIPEDEIEFRLDDTVVGKIVNIKSDTVEPKYTEEEINYLYNKYLDNRIKNYPKDKYLTIKEYKAQLGLT